MIQWAANSQKSAHGVKLVSVAKESGVVRGPLEPFDLELNWSKVSRVGKITDMFGSPGVRVSADRFSVQWMLPEDLAVRLPYAATVLDAECDPMAGLGF